MTTCEVIFKGRVQGVGFRYTACDMARESGICGWVTNLPDGSVQLLAEGEEALVEDLISRLSAHFSVREKKVCCSPARYGLTGFTVKY
ncbi:MAG: acylphosphatase [Candidatus Omnitrophica bacterium]|nr:acylphosphatase [Candidatus Omnitrophota bacterium]